MNSSPKPPEAEPLLFAQAGITAGPSRPSDPFVAFFDLMGVVEELCPVWPQREPPRDGGIWLL